MPTRTWLSQDHQFVPGAVLFQSPRRFSMWTYTISHSQLLLRSRTPTLTGGGRHTRVDILFKPVKAMKVRQDYNDGILLRCATAEERERIIADTRPPSPGNRRVIMIESDGTTGYVVTTSVGWQEDDQQDMDTSDLALFAGGLDALR